MILTLRRVEFSDTYVMGELLLDDAKYCDTLEDPPRKTKIPKLTGIPVGQYEVIVSYSNRFRKQMPLLLNVPGFSGVRIHGGRDERDTEGCILVGEKVSPGRLRLGPGVSADLTRRLLSASRIGKLVLIIE